MASLLIIVDMLNLAGSLLMLLLFFVNPRMRTRALKFIMWETWCSVLVSLRSLSQIVINVGGLAKPSWLCWSQAIWGQFFVIAALACNVVVCINLFLSVFSPFVDTYKYYPAYHAFVWCIAAASTAIVFGFAHGVTPKIGNDDPCGLSNGLQWNFLSGIGYVVPLLCFWTFALLVVLYALRVYRRGLPASQEHRRSLLVRLLAYEILFLALYSPVVVYPIMNFTSRDNIDDVIKYAGFIGSSLFGFFSTVVWLTLPGFPFYAVARCECFTWLSDKIFLCCTGCCCSCLFTAMCCHCSPCLSCCGCLPCHEHNRRRQREKVKARMAPARIAREIGVEVEQWDYDVIVEVFRKEIVAGVLLGIEKSLGGDSVASHGNVSLSAAPSHAVSAEPPSGSSVNDADHPAGADWPYAPPPPAGSYGELNAYGSHLFATLDYETIHCHEVQPFDQSATLIFSSHAPSVFADIRTAAGLSKEAFLKSLNPAQLYASASSKFSEGKSGSFFFMTDDKEMILKAITESEAAVLGGLLPVMHPHMEKYPKSSIVRILGWYSIRMLEGPSYHFIVMENLFRGTKCEISTRFDIKGSQRSASESSSLLLDSNVNRTFPIGQERANQLVTQLTLDAAMLRDCGIMDYSLLIGVASIDTESGAGVKEEEGRLYMSAVPASAHRREIFFVGVIDILQDYSFSKKMERLWKGTLSGKGDVISSVPPDLYCRRFVDRMETLFQ